MFDKLIRTKPFIFSLIGLSIIAIASSIALLLNSKSLKGQLDQTKQLLVKVNEEKQRVETEKEATTKENEKLQADTLNYVKLNNDFQKEKEALQKKLDDAQKVLENKEAELERQKTQLAQDEKKLTKDQAVLQRKLSDEKKSLENKLKDLETTLKKERALFHYNLAISYSKAGMNDEAIEEYRKSLTFDEKNADAYYNLAVLYKDIKTDNANAVFNYEKYLELKPDADDAEEVKNTISIIKSN
ncbi:MAG: tetratricopeptide repeat protein [Candidatus Omnitrophica bacterium]|nr:tetratricopeptide repeat protein [Candidatus Omnitrophota bacterium]